MRTKTRVSLGIAAVATASLLAGCSGGSGNEPQSDIKLRMTMWTSNPDQIALFEQIGEEFMADYPAVTDIEFESLTLDQLDTVLTTQIQGGNPPDLTWLPVESSLEYISAGALVDLSDTLKSTEGYNVDDLVPALQKRWRVDGAQYGVPFSTGPLVMYYNKDLYAQAGVASPEQLIAEGNWTWESFQETSRQLTEALGIPGYVVNDFDFQNWTRLLPLLYAYGASPWNDAADECTADSPEMVEAMSVFHEMVFTDSSSPLPGQQADFFGGQAAATSAFLSSNTLLQDATFEWGIVPTPAGPAGDTQALGQAAIVALSAGTQQQAATDFLAFLTNEENAARLAQFYPPARESLLEPATIVGSSPILTEELVQPIVEASKSSGEIFPVAENAAEVADSLNSALDEYVYRPNADLDKALGKVCDELSAVL